MRIQQNHSIVLFEKIGENYYASCAYLIYSSCPLKLHPIRFLPCNWVVIGLFCGPNVGRRRMGMISDSLLFLRLYKGTFPGLLPSPVWSSSQPPLVAYLIGRTSPAHPRNGVREDQGREPRRRDGRWGPPFVPPRIWSIPPPSIDFLLPCLLVSASLDPAHSGLIDASL